MSRELLMIDDNATLLKVMGRSLAAFYNVTTFINPRDAITYMLANPTKLDIIISDYKMPDMNGLELLEKASAINYVTIRILLTGFINDVSIDTKSDVCDIVLDKNICKNIKDIVAVVDKLGLQKNQPVNPE